MYSRAAEVSRCHSHFLPTVANRTNISTCVVVCELPTLKDHLPNFWDQRCATSSMAENVPPGSATKPAAGADRPGLPYYEKLRRDLRDTLQKKRLLDRSMVRSACHISSDILTNVGCYRGPDLPSRNRLPRRNLCSRQHRERLR